MPTNMLERVLSVRRVAYPHSDSTASAEFENDNDEATADGDGSKKTKKHQQIRLATRAVANYFTRMGPIGLCLVFLFFAFIATLFLLLFHSRPFVCVSSYDPVSRSGFFGLDGLASDFGSLGVPWCKPPILSFFFTRIRSSVYGSNIVFIIIMNFVYFGIGFVLYSALMDLD